MATPNEAVQAALKIDGAKATAMVDIETGMTLATAGSGIDLEVAGAGNTEVLRAKLRVMDSTGIQGPIEDIMIILKDQFHIIHPLTAATGQGLFLYLALEKDKANLAMARRQLENIEKAIEI
ncbi:hypothetical protein [Demequina zhanjiangensis]|uniref:Roadblock/LAMTOR2 domain-containing protein n=1 Tax=Demequina zhanjiangensis TaxID=3051659 RepID=A0ABT8G4V6_9MICO|nr:hypothetical protein [Demequina sp. SYSU T00b26]MDN4474178.1 hypothetical protein [Demequina sp. SYSU T00b26]